MPMQHVAGMPCGPRRDRRGRTGQAPERTRAASFVGPALAATVAAATCLHLLAELASRLPAADPLGALSVLAGMAAVLAVLMPFTVLWACRAQRAWSGWSRPQPEARPRRP